AERADAETLLKLARDHWRIENRQRTSSPSRRSFGNRLRPTARQRGEIFLIDPRYGRIHHLNATGAALWRLLGDPLRLGEIVQTFSDAFPDSTRRVHKKRLKRILEDPDDSELLERPGEES
ncbi:MAG TPA: PqqD family protein, partial [Propylenella sp.]